MEPQPNTPPMAPPKSPNPMDNATRQAKRLAEVRDAGGDKVAAVLTREPYEALMRIIERRGGPAACTRTQAIAQAVLELDRADVAREKRRRAS